MNFRFTLAYLGASFLIGALAFNVIVIFLFRSGLVFSARNQEGHFKKRIPMKGILTMLSFLGIIIGFIVAANYFGLAARGFTLNFGSLFLLNLALIISLIIYDTLVIDWIVIGHWRPGFLKLPATMNKAEMRDHIRKTIIAGPVFGTLLALASTTISYFTWM